MPAPSLSSQARQVSSAAIPQNKVIYGGDETDQGSHPWLGSMRSRTQESVPRNFISGGTNFLYLPRDNSWRRRLGQTIQFDDFGTPVGLLPAKWGAKARWADSYLDDTFTDGLPTIACLLTKETLADPLVIDDGRFSNYWLRNRVDNTNYTLGSEFDDDTYPAPGEVQTLRFIPLWYDSGDGGITRGEDEFARRFFMSGSRRWLKVGNWTYFPSLLGTPSRWQRKLELGQNNAPLGPFVPNSDINNGGPGAQGWDGPYTGSGGTPTGGPDKYPALDTNDGDTLYLGVGPTGANQHIAGLDGVIPPGRQWTVTVVCRTFNPNIATTGSFRVELVDSAGDTYRCDADASLVGLDDSWTTFVLTVNGAGTPVTTGTPNSIELTAAASAGGPALYVLTTFASVSEDASVDVNRAVNRLIPSGPLPPTHSGSLAPGNPVAGSAGATTTRPDADVSDGAWLNQAASATDLFESINETTVDDTDYIVDTGAAGTLCEIGLTDPGFTPTSATWDVRLSFRASLNSLGFGVTGTLTVRLREGASTTRASKTFTNVELSSGGAMSARWVSYDLTAAEINAITSAADLRFQFEAGGTAGVRVYYAAIEFTPVGEAAEGGWKGSDRFMYSVAYRFEDQSVWMPCLPRFPNTILSEGFNLFTVDAANTTTTYDKVVWNNIPIGPYGVIGRILLRTPKIDSTAADNLQIDPFDLRIVNEVKDNTSTTYDDYSADDDSLVLDQAEQFIRYDHIMPPRSRYNFGGDMRICHSYGGLNPCAIEISPVGRVADYDLNAPDGTDSLYNQDASYLAIVISDSGNDYLELIQSDGATTTASLAIEFAIYNTLQKVVDRINATSIAADGFQWRAQICPGQNPEASCVNTLTPHIRSLSSVVRNGTTTITRATGGLGDVAVGALVTGTGYTAGTIVTEIVSDTELTISATATAGTGSAVFRFNFGDQPFPAAAEGYQRVIANSLPGFLFWNKTYLDDFPLDKSAIWMTVASPGASKSAANCFSARIDNKFIPPGNPGISMGGAGVDQGFVTPFGNAIYAIRNVREQGTGLDQDYRLEAINESRGCCAWNTISPGNRFVPYLTSEGMCVADLFNEVLISSDVYVDAPLPGLGDFTYEIPLCVAATASDTDGAYASARIMRSMLWVNFRSTGSLPNRQTCYDFSSGSDSAGLPAVVRSRNQAWGWSVPLVRAFTAMCLGTRADGFHLYGFNDANVGSTGDGRVDEFETSDTDNGTAIAGSIETPWEDLGRNTLISAQEITLLHAAPTGSTGSLIFHRSYLDQQFTMTPSTSNTLPIIRDIKMLTLPARTPTAACFISYTQATGGPREVREIELRLKSLPSYR